MSESGRWARMTRNEGERRLQLLGRRSLEGGFDHTPLPWARANGQVTPTDTRIQPSTQLTPLLYSSFHFYSPSSSLIATNTRFSASKASRGAIGGTSIERNICFFVFCAEQRQPKISILAELLRISVHSGTHLIAVQQKMHSHQHRFCSKL